MVHKGVSNKLLGLGSNRTCSVRVFVARFCSLIFFIRSNYAGKQEVNIELF